MALQVHPDKNSSADATEKFQEINKAYNILIDEEKRAIYDEFGTVDDNINIKDTYEFYRNIYPKLTRKRIEEYQANYLNSEEEKQDIINYYNNHNGSMIKILEHIFFSGNKDIPRLIKIIEQCFEDKLLVKNSNYVKTKSKIKLLDEIEVSESEESGGNDENLKDKKKKNDNEFSKLAEKMMQKQKEREGFIDNLEKKYTRKVYKNENKDNNGMNKKRKK